MQDERHSTDPSNEPPADPHRAPSVPSFTMPTQGLGGEVEPKSHAVRNGVIGVFSFFGALIAFGLTMMSTVLSSGPALAAFGACLLVVLGLFWARKKRGPSSAFGAVAIGAALALAVVGQCSLMMHDASMH